MNLLNGNGSRLRRFVAGRLGVASTSMSATCLIIACLAVWMVFLSFACSGRRPTQPPHECTHTPTPTHTPSPTASPTPTPTPLPPVTLIKPQDDECIDCGSEVMLQWSWLRALETDEYYRLRVWGGGYKFPPFYPVEDHFDLPSTLLPGEYNWAIAIVRPVGPDTYEPVSKESESFHFHIVPPPPVVRSISPTSMFRGKSVQVSIIGENFTHTVALTIGVPLSVTFVDSTKITTTIPMTLEVDQYPVIVQDPRGRGISSVFFTVEPRKATTTTTTPQPSAYPPPVLTDNTVIGCNVTFRWQWPRQLANNEWFAVRVGKAPDIPHSQYWGKEYEYTYSLSDAGDYVWEVAICRGDPATAVCEQLAVSQRGTFSFGGCPKPTNIDNTSPCRPPDC